MGPIIRDRDAYMAKAIAAAATQRPGVAPALVLGEVEGQLLWRYMVPEDAPLGSAPKGSGDGAFGPLEGVAAVVGVVGSAHVHGMVNEWQRHVGDVSVNELLRVEGQTVRQPGQLLEEQQKQKQQEGGSS
jgi:hypothetical protein